KYDVRLPIGQLFVSVEKNDTTEEIGLNHRFIFGRNVYEITGMDDITTVNDEGYGIIQYTAKITTKREEDDFVNNIAHNAYKYADSGTVGDGHSNDGEEGGLW